VQLWWRVHCANVTEGVHCAVVQERLNCAVVAEGVLHVVQLWEDAQL